MRAIVLALAVWVSGAAGQDVLTWHNDVARTGQNLREVVLTPANVNAKTFDKLFVIAVDGKVDAEPLYLHGLPIPKRGTRNVLFVATEHDSVYAFDADSGHEFWHVLLLRSGETTDARTLKQRSALNLTPSGEEGAIWQSGAGPVADPQGNIYVMLGNGDFDSTLDARGFPARGDFGNSFLKIPAYFNGNLYYASTENPLRQYRFRNARLLPEPASQKSMWFCVSRRPAEPFH